MFKQLFSKSNNSSLKANITPAMRAGTGRGTIMINHTEQSNDHLEFLGKENE